MDETIQISVPWVLGQAADWMEAHGYPATAGTIRAEQERIANEAAAIAQLDAAAES